MRKTMSEWIDVKEKLPEDNQLVLVAMSGINLTHHNVHIGYFRRDSGWGLPYWDGVVKILYWLEIPNPPNMKEK